MTYCVTLQLQRQGFFFSFNFYFILGGRLQGQRVYMKEWEMNGIGIHGVKSTKKLIKVKIGFH